MRSLVHQNKGILLTPSRFLPAILYCLAQSVRPTRCKSKYNTRTIPRYHLMRHCCRPRSLPMRSSTIAQNISLSLSRFAYFRFSSSMFAISFACSIVNSFTILVSFSSSSFVQGPYINRLVKHLKGASDSVPCLRASLLFRWFLHRSRQSDAIRPTLVLTCSH